MAINSSSPPVWKTVSCGSKPSLPPESHRLLVLGVFSLSLPAVLRHFLVVRQKSRAELGARRDTLTGLGWLGPDTWPGGDGRARWGGEGAL